MNRISTSKARKAFREVMKRASAAGGQRIKITHYGKTLAALIPPKDLQLLEECESRPEKPRRPARSAKSRKAAG